MTSKLASNPENSIGFCHDTKFEIRSMVSERLLNYYTSSVYFLCCHILLYFVLVCSKCCFKKVLYLELILVFSVSYRSKSVCCPYHGQLYSSNFLCIWKYYDVFYLHWESVYHKLNSYMIPYFFALYCNFFLFCQLCNDVFFSCS